MAVRNGGQEVVHAQGHLRGLGVALAQEGRGRDGAAGER